MSIYLEKNAGYSCSSYEKLSLKAFVFQSVSQVILLPEEQWV